MSDPITSGAEGIEDPLGPPGAGDPAPADAPEPDRTVPPGPADPMTSSSTAGEGPDDSDADGESADFSRSSMEDLVADLERTAAERDDLRDRLARNQADFENSRRRLNKESTDAATRAAEALVERLLPVLDGCDGAISHGASEVEPIFASLLGTLEKEGLARVDPLDDPFDPNLHEAVMHEPATDSDDATVVSAVMRPGYTWKGRVIRPAMVKVRG